MAKKILVVDDDSVSRLVLVAILKQMPRWEVVECSDGQAALDLLCDGLRPDLCLIDLQMPKMDGQELVQRVRRDPQLQALKIVIVSGSRDKEIVASLAKLQVSGYLLKPFDTAKVQVLLQQILSISSASPIPLARNIFAKTALVVETEREERHVTSALVRQVPGWEVVEVRSAEDAVEYLNNEAQPNAVILGMVKPDLDGLKTIQSFQDRFADLRIVVSPLSIDREGVQALAKLKITGLLPKPIRPQDLQTVLQKCR
jgi:CheY-like chemotaxis protein